MLQETRKTREESWREMLQREEWRWSVWRGGGSVWRGAGSKGGRMRRAVREAVREARDGEWAPSVASADISAVSELQVQPVQTVL
jgi:hypothetical protein